MNKNCKVRTIEIVLYSSAGALIVRKDVLYERHRILQEKRKKASNMAGTFDTFVTEIKLKLPELSNSAKICAKCHLSD